MVRQRPVVAGADLGGTGARLVVVSDGMVLAQRAVPTPELGAGAVPERVFRMAGALRQLVPPDCRLTSVGIGASGPMELPRGPIRNVDTLPWFSGFDLIGGLEAELGLRVALDSDAVSAALGEYHFGAGRGYRRVLAVTLGTGIGVAFLCDGKPWRDRFGQHPEGGHLGVLPGGQRCYCGLAGCWETVASRSSLEARVGHVLPGGDLAQAERLLKGAGVEGLRDAFVDYGHAVGRGLEVLDVAYSPDRIVLCGSVSRFLPYFEPGLTAELRRAPGYANDIEVVPSALGDLAGAIGASLLTV